MIEKLARALAASESGEPDYYDKTTDVFTRGAWQRDVRAILEALRDPSPETVEAGQERIEGSSAPQARKEALEVWQAMIDTILNERKG